MRFFFIILFFFSLNGIKAQFTVSGQISNYANQQLLIRILNGPNDKLINKVQTDNSGNFSVKIPENYNGIVRITSGSRHAILDILSANEDVSFTSNFENEKFANIVFTKGNSAIGFKKYQDFEAFNDLKLNVFPLIKTTYKQDDEFYKAVVKEEDRLNKLSPISEAPLLKYYIETNEIANSVVEGKPAADEHKNKILNKLVTDNNYLEGTGFMSKLVLDYLRYSIVGASTQDQINSIIEKEIDSLLEKTDLETPRGQNVLSSIFLVLPPEQFASLLEKYYSKADALTCEMTEDLKTTLTAHSSIVVGKVVPNIEFKYPVNGYNSLYDVKSDKKIIIFWASWCPACKDELPFIKEYYENFKKEGGEIVSISLDYDESEFKNATKDFKWVNYTELNQWDTPAVSLYGVSSTPTLLLVDKENKLIKKGTHISELVDF